MGRQAAAAEPQEPDPVDEARTAIDDVMGGPADVPSGDELVEASNRRAAQMLWRLRKLRANERAVRAEYAQIEEELAAAKRFQLDPIEKAIAGLETALALWHHARRSADPKHSATIHLPTGTLESRKAEPRLEVVDQAAFLGWASASFTEGIRKPPPPADEVAKDPVKKELTDAAKYQINDDHTVTVKATGEKVPGIKVLPGGTADLGVNYKAKT